MHLYKVRIFFQFCLNPFIYFALACSPIEAKDKVFRAHDGAGHHPKTSHHLYHSFDVNQLDQCPASLTVDQLVLAIRDLKLFLVT